eukprot:CAMPEP_0202915096 /NCGR_PEP_ID=MMETSP1392-20130828/64809_1 /ASSEMBLY_ACC=CAM_ASM_000868 /TAXON_ID=225041 /ORGANISM="Chlamydomonas chlamydogama, Strain SAG 11-48b" /LENGTH=549 /DNA_ID=CAMNT_0049606991 /DNA_START=71 /DNA_END=1716 /DNA_ORIENTATION=+
MRYVLVATTLWLLAGVVVNNAEASGEWHGIKLDDVPHVDTCNYCMKCIVDGPPPARFFARQLHETPEGDSSDHAHANSWLGHGSAATYSDAQQDHISRSSVRSNTRVHRQLQSTDSQAAAFSPPPPIESLGRYAAKLQPLDELEKRAKPNCTICRGCNVDLAEVGSAAVSFSLSTTIRSTAMGGVGGIQFTHGKGASNSWLFFAKPAGSDKRYILKVFCVPISKVRNTAPPKCSARTYSERLELMLGQQKLVEDCGVQEIAPRVWFGPVSAVLPGIGYHVRWYGLWMEEARGITLHGLSTARHAGQFTYQLMGRMLNRTQVQMGAIMDVLTAQCDRHSENIFVDSHGNLQYIDNDKALGVVSNCGFDSMIIPTSRYHSVLRIGYWHHIANYYRRNRHRVGFCKGPVDMRSTVDYRCTAPNGTLGTAYPATLSRCMAMLKGLEVPAIMERYGFSKEKPAIILKNRATDMMERGFEWTLEHGAPRNGPRFRLPAQPPCCELVLENKMLTCAHCWMPLLPEDYANTTDLAVVSSLIGVRRPPAAGAGAGAGA